MIFCDTETTGLIRPEATDINLQPHLLEVCFIKTTNNFDFVDEFTSFVKPPIPIPDEITKITGITNEMVRNSLTFIQLYDKIADFFLGEKIFVAHNAPFDLGVLRYELMRHGLEYKFPYPPDQRCTVEISKPIFNRSLKLTNLHEWACGAIFINGAHRARNDVLALIRCYIKLHKEGYVK